MRWKKTVSDTESTCSVSVQCVKAHCLGAAKPLLEASACWFGPSPVVRPASCILAEVGDHLKPCMSTATCDPGSLKP